MSAGFTPGPWEYCSCGCGFIGGGDDMVCEVTEGEWGDVSIDLLTGKRCLVHHWGTIPPERAQANARLIAAAPALYEALDTLLRLFPVTVKGPAVDAIIAADSALAQARGETA